MFSLQELARMEEERLREVEMAAQRARDAHTRVEREARERERRAEQAREREEAVVREEMERRVRDEEARLGAIHRAAVEAARAATEAKARREQRESEQRHELELEWARAHGRRRAAKNATAGGVAGVALTAGLAVALYLGILAPREARRVSDGVADLATRDESIHNFRERVAGMEREARVHGEELAALSHERATLRAELEGVRRQRAPTPATPRASPARSTYDDRPRLDGFTTCAPDSKDPLCAH